MCSPESPANWPTLGMPSALAEIGFAGLPIVLALITLTVRGHLCEALCWGGGMLLGLGAVLIIKRLMADATELAHFPSGHVALAVTFNGCLAFVLFGPKMSPRWRSLCILAIMGAIAVAEEISRMILTEHGWLGIAGGFLVGICGLAAAGSPWAWGAIGRKDRVCLGGTLLAGLPFGWLIAPHVSPWMRRVAGV